ncbi:MAG TPA: hypothetical protein VJK29_19465, partial [Terriglobales bacterium]|nr:hypothetical protein [Terriglobales bacterium]
MSLIYWTSTPNCPYRARQGIIPSTHLLRLYPQDFSNCASSRVQEVCATCKAARAAVQFTPTEFNLKKGKT